MTGWLARHRVLAGVAAFMGGLALGLMLARQWGWL